MTEVPAPTLRVHGSHAPTRQVFMSAVVDLMSRAEEPLAILEVGSDMGASVYTWTNAALHLHAGSSSITCVDTWESESSLAMFLFVAEQCRPVIDVRHRRGRSEEILPRLPDAGFDIVYIDACHFYREALLDIGHGMRLVREGGILCGDDLEFQAGECDLAFAGGHRDSDYVLDPRAGTGYHPGVTLAVHEALGPVSCFDGFWAMRKAAGGFERVSLAGMRGVLPLHWPAETVDKLREYFGASDGIAALV